MGSRARQAADDALSNGELFVSAISFWEFAMLVSKGRLRLSADVSIWREELLFDGLAEFSVDGDMGSLGGRISGLHGDPADRIILATAILTGCQLMTADHRLLAWVGDLERFDARV